MAMRDPRLNPAVGDVLRKGKTERRVTSIAACGPAFMVIYARNQKLDGGAWLFTWRKWAKDAEVLRVGGVG